MTDDNELKNIDHDDISDIFVKVEKSFGIKFNNIDLMHISTFGQFCMPTQKQLIELYQTAKSTASEHIKNICSDEELTPGSKARKIRTVQGVDFHYKNLIFDCFDIKKKVKDE
jgi:hypothetical protein